MSRLDEAIDAILGGGRCTYCGAFRLDGLPPTVHFTRCGLGPDGSQIGPLRSGGTRWREWRADRDARADRDVQLPPAAGRRRVCR